MTRLLLLAAAAAVVLAAPARANTFTGQGSWFKGSNWSAGHAPTKLEPVLVPAGREATLPRFGAESNSLTLAGRVAGVYPVTVYNSLTVEPGGDPDAPVNMDGLGGIRSEGEAPYWLYLKGVHWLETPLKVETTLWVESGGTFRTHGNEVVVPGETYQANHSSLYMEGSTWRTGSWYIYPPWIETLEAETATVIVNRPAGLGTLNNSFFSGVEWTYGNVTIEGSEPRTRGSFQVAGTLTLNRSEGGIALEAGSTIKTSELATDGSEAEPADVHSTVPGEPAYLEVEGPVPAGVSFTDVVVS